MDLESAATWLYDLGYRELGEVCLQAEAGRISNGTLPSSKGRKKLVAGPELGDVLLIVEVSMAQKGAKSRLSIVRCRQSCWARSFASSVVPIYLWGPLRTEPLPEQDEANPARPRHDSASQRNPSVT